ncbi:MAG: ATP-dependent metallopeptidase FtsH/Yme1/Tma family protein [Myxococcales bacterium]|nr:ATP-dependent metallopeptidase FtsH/Yme1/Tma family protein [Myxococcales bacterium]MCB9519458.1 ATP-dependent metallopeptidase FtsH/Yme1/Tma family protein [Myxococcales bacterium]MCB9530806.1 ATP-dependent metallopeptidase FtsH/Yme1/Tma family protein [Myxococcales bacterium]
MRQAKKSPLLLVVIGVLLVFLLTKIFSSAQPNGSELAFSAFRDAVAAGQVAEVTISGDGRIEGTYTDDGAAALGASDVNFKTVGRVSDDLQDLMSAQGVEFTFKRDEQSLLQPLLGAFLPLLLVGVIVVYMMRQVQNSGGKAMSFGKSRARLLNESQNKVTFEDISGVDEAKEELQEIVEFLRDPKKFTRLGGRIPKGVLLMGPPGTGKTLLARGVAGEAGVPFFSISGSDFVEMFVGVGASRVRDLFEQAKKHAPCIIFIDEIDAVGRHRGAGLGGGHDEREQTLNQLLVEMDGFESNEGVILIAATNRPDVLDPALLRPGRFDRRVVVPRPDVAGREGILAVHTRKTPLAPDVDLSIIAKSTPGFSGADLESLVNEAALLAARRNKDRIERNDLDDAKDKVLMGAERRSAIISDRDRRVTAYHEAGHALVTLLLPSGRDVDPLHKVTIIPRGRALGVTQQLPAEDRLNASREWALNRIAILMGGRAAEELVFDQITSGAGSDIQQATELARKMVCEWGMSTKLGPLNLAGDGNNEVFLGRDYTRGARPYSEQTAQEIDDEIREIVNSHYTLARQILEDNMAMLRELAEALLEFEVLDSSDIELVMAGKVDELRDSRTAREREAKKRRSPLAGYVSKDASDRPREPVLKPATATSSEA